MDLLVNPKQISYETGCYSGVRPKLNMGYECWAQFGTLGLVVDITTNRLVETNSGQLSILIKPLIDTV